MRKLITELAPDLARGVQGAGFTPGQLCNALETLQKDNPTIVELRRKRHVLHRLLSDLQARTGGAVGLPDVEVSVPRPASPFFGTSVGEAAALARLKQAFVDDVARHPQSISGADDRTAAARILFSSIAWGGFLDPQLLTALPAALSRSFYSLGDHCWVDLSLCLPGEPAHVRRWFLDPITQCLVLRWRADGRCWPKARADTLLRLLLSNLARRTGGSSTITTVTALRRAAETRLRLHLPQVLVDFLRSARAGESLPPRVWWRLSADYHLEPDLAEEEDPLREELERVDPGRGVFPTRAGSRGRTEVRKMLSEFMKCLRRPGRRSFLGRADAMRALREFQERNQCDQPMLAQIIAWSIWRLGWASGGKIKPSSLYRYLSSFAPALMDFAGEIDPVAATAAEFERCYGHVLEASKSVQERAMAVRCLRWFHAFLIFSCDAPPAEIEGRIFAPTRVRANLLSEREYGQTLDIIRGTKLPKRTQAMLQLTLVLAVRLGLRRNELRYMRITDIRTDPAWLRPVLWLRAHPDRGLKTHSSTRELPLAHLLSDEELALLRKWYQRRRTEAKTRGSAQALLLCLNGNDRNPVPDEHLDALIAVMRAVTNDPTLVWHSLRHTFVTNLTAELMLRGREASGLPAMVPWQRPPSHENLLQRLFGTSGLPRQLEYAVSTLAGHIDPHESTRTYTHLFDFLAALWLRDLCNGLGAAFWAALEGITKSAIHSRHSRRRKRGAEVIPAHLDSPARLLVEHAPPRPAGHPRLGEIDPNVLVGALDLDADTPSLERIYFAIGSIARRSPVSWVGITGFPRSLCDGLSTNARFLAGLESSTRNSKARQPRHVVAGRRRVLPVLARSPQLDGLGPALPKIAPFRRDAVHAFDRVVATMKPKAACRLALYVLTRSGRNVPGVQCKSLQEAQHIWKVFRRFKIAGKHLRIMVRSVPRGVDDAVAWAGTIRESIGDRGLQVEVEKRSGSVHRAAAAHPEGIMFVQVVRKGRRCSGWRIGMYYAICWLAAWHRIDLAAL